MGCTVVCISLSRELDGILALSNVLKPEAKGVITALQRQGMDLWIVSGDHQTTVNAVGHMLSVTNRVGGVLPEEKFEKIRLLQDRGKVVTMVGDGINDAPALGQAHVGIALGVGAHIAISAADIILVKNDLRDVLITFRLCKEIVRKIRWNFAWEHINNVVAIPIAAGVLVVANEDG